MDGASDPLINYFSAVIDGLVSLDLNSVAQGLQQCRINFQTPIGVSALTLALNSDKIGIPVLEMLLDAGFEHNGIVADGSGHTIIMKALLNGVSCDKIRYLVTRGANIKFNGPHGNALHFAIKASNSTNCNETLEFLLKCGIDINDRSSGISPIELAVEEYKFSILRYLLLEQKIQKPIINSTVEVKLAHPLHCIAIKKLISASVQTTQYVGILDLLLQAGVDVNEKEGNCSPLTYAIMARKQVAAVELLERGAKINDSIDVFSACERKVIDVLNELIKRGASVKALSKKGKTTVHAVLAKPNKNLPVMIWFAPLMEDLDEMLSILAKNGADFNHADQDGVVPLMMADSLECFLMLEKYGADPNIKVNGESLLHLLLEVNTKIEVYSYVALKLRGSVNEKDRDGLTPLLHLISKLSRGYEHMGTDGVKVLIETGADIDAVDNDGQSAIFYAVRMKSDNLLGLLMSHGASITIRDKKGNNILHEIAQSKRAKYYLPIIVKYAPREQILELINGKNKEKYYPEDLAKDKGIEYLFKEKLVSASKRGIDIFTYETLFPTQIAKLRNGFQYKQAEISHEYMTDMQPVDSFLHLPQEVVLAIMKFASVETVVALSTTCHQLKIWSDDNTLWRELLTREFDRCQSVMKCQNVKQEFAKKWNAQVNMKLGNYFVMKIVDHGEEEEVNLSSTAMDYSSELNLLAFLTNNRLVAIDTKSFQVLFKVPSNNNHWELLTPRVQIFPELKQILCFFGEQMAVVNSETGQRETVPELPISLSLSSDGDLAAFVLRNGTIQVWNWVTKSMIWELKAEDDWDGEDCRMMLINGKLARTNLMNNSTEIWDIKTRALEAEIKATSLVRCGKYFVISSYRRNEQKFYYDTVTSRTITRDSELVMDPNGNLLASMDNKYYVDIYEYADNTKDIEKINLVASKRLDSCQLGALHGNLLFTYSIEHDEIDVLDARSLKRLYTIRDLGIVMYPLILVRGQFIVVTVTDGLAIINFNM